MASRVEGIRVKVDTRVNQLGIKVIQVDSKLGSLDNEIKVARNNVQENSDEILRRQWECAEQIQVEMQREKERVEKRIEKLRSERVSRELIQGKGVVNHTSGVTESVRGIVTINATMNVPTTTSRFLGTPGGMNTNVSASHSPINESTRSSVHSSLSNSDFSMPIFDECFGVNPLFHIRQLDEFIQLRGVLPAHQLVIARKSITGNLSKQWLEAIYDKLKDYDDFRKTFLNTWWSQPQQSTVKCNLY
jgi:hypothetical protein